MKSPDVMVDVTTAKTDRQVCDVTELLLTNRSLITVANSSRWLGPRSAPEGLSLLRAGRTYDDTRCQQPRRSRSPRASRCSR